MQQSPCYEQKASALSSQSKFACEAEKVMKALARFDEAVDRIKGQFSPVIGPDMPAGAIACKDTPVPPRSDFEAFISSTCDRIYRLAERLDYYCERSAV